MISPALLRGLTQSRYPRGFDRRSVLRLGAAAAGGLAATSALAACGVAGQQKPPPTPAEIRQFWAAQQRHGKINFANWPLYMDPARGPIKEFTARTGIAVTYQEVIQDAPSWFGKIQPQLAAGQSIGYDLMVVTNGIELTKLRLLGYLLPLDHSRLKNFAKYAGAAYKKENFDPGNVFTIPYTSGITGIAYNPKYVKRPITSMADLWDPAFKGKVGMMGSTDELGAFGMIRAGVNPEKGTERDWDRAATLLRQQRDSGIVRAYYEQNYIKPLTNGDIWLTMAWSGDIFQQNVSEGSGLKFVIPREGGTLWTDNMMIPRGAENPVDAMMLMDYFYEPPVASDVTEYINYITPVPSVQNVIRSRAGQATGEDAATLSALATSTMVFPTAAEYARLFRFAERTPAQDRDYQKFFQPIVEG